MKVPMRKLGGVLVADNQQAVEALAKIKENADVMADIRQSRNIKNHRRFFAFLNAVIDMQEHFESIEALRFWLVMKAGYIESFSAPNGHVIYKPKSLDFASMDETDFQEVFNQCITVVVREFELDRDALDRVVDFA